MRPLNRPARAAALYAVLAASPVIASAQGIAEDARCFLVSDMFSRVGADDKTKEVAVKSSFFYLGRLSGSAAQIEAALAEQARAMSPQNASSTMQACVQNVERKARELQQIGQRLSRTQGN
jgi:hypothetical protein